MVMEGGKWEHVLYQFDEQGKCKNVKMTPNNPILIHHAGGSEQGSSLEGDNPRTGVRESTIRQPVSGILL